jgi:hypothetical protein
MYFQNNVDQIFIFSDDIEWCRSIFGNEVNYVQDTPGVQLFLMSKMKHLILSNSTFAWWGAYLNGNKEKKVIAPKKWFGEKNKHLKTEDIYCKNWIKL